MRGSVFPGLGSEFGDRLTLSQSSSARVLGGVAVHSTAGRESLNASIAPGTVADYLTTARRIRSGELKTGAARRIVIGIARGFTIEPLLPFLEVECARAGVLVDVSVGGFGAFRQELLDERSTLYRARPDVLLLAIGPESLCPELVTDFLALDTAPQRVEDRVIDDLRALVEAIRARSNAVIVLQTLAQPAYVSAGLADGRLRPGQREVFERLNRAIRALANEWPGVEVFDLDAHVAGVGRLRWEDPRFGLVARAPIAAANLPGLARAYAQIVAAVAGVQRKCVVVDLDGTLWGGVLGEDGADGIAVGSDYPGSAFVAFQRALLDLRRRGVVLAISSKNEEADVDAVFAWRREMVLRREDFVAARINWRDKATAVRELALDLGFALSALVFIDDDPIERSLVSRELPEVLVPDWPREPAAFVAALNEIPGLHPLRITEEDRRRTESYRGEVKRAEVRRSAVSLEDFYYSLAMRAMIGSPPPTSFARVAQLITRSTQFNLTLRRYTEADIEALCASPSDDLHALTLSDRFGDSGLVAVASTRYEGEIARIEAFVMSCRVLGRGVETLLLGHVAATAKRRGAGILEGTFVQGPRNSQVADFYVRHGFRASDDEASRFRFDLADGRIDPPAWISHVPPLASTVSA